MQVGGVAQGWSFLASESELPQTKCPFAVAVIEKTIQDEDPVTRELARKTHYIFKEIAHTMTSSTIKQTFRRWFKFIYTKKLKPLYNWPKNYSHTPMDPMKDVKEALVEEEEEEILIKSYRSEDLEQGIEGE